VNSKSLERDPEPDVPVASTNGAAKSRAKSVTKGIEDRKVPR
jgi:hypothetical protein